MNRANTYGLFLILLSWALLFPSAAFAADATTLGGMMTNVYTEMQGMPKLVTAFAYISATYLLVMSIYKFKDHVNKPDNAPLSAAVKRMVASGSLYSLPYLSQVMVGNLLGGTAAGSAGIQGAMGANATVATEVDGKLYAFVTNIYGPMTQMLTAFTYIAAIIFLILGISRLLNGADKGPKAPGGLGTIMTFIVSGALFASGDMAGIFTSSLFGNANVNTYPVISDSILTADQGKDRVASVVSALLLFVNLVGFIAFIRGWFVLRQVADGGGGNATYMQAFTFLGAGTIAINIGKFIDILQKTMGISDVVSFST